MAAKMNGRDIVPVQSRHGHAFTMVRLADGAGFALVSAVNFEWLRQAGYGPAWTFQPAADGGEPAVCSWRRGAGPEALSHVLREAGRVGAVSKL